MINVVRILRDNECPNCNGNLICIEKETSIYDVDDDGNITPYYNNFDSFYSTELYCSKCNKEYRAKIIDGVVKRITKSYEDESKKEKPFNPFYGG